VNISENIGVYLHVPFCARPCEFCAFYQKTPDASGIEAYLDSIERELEKFPPPEAAQTIFMGGGTPSLLSTPDLYRLCRSLKRYLPNIKEWSIEIAPPTLKPDKLAMLQEVGVNRFSMGIQSFNENTLDAIGRVHTAAQVSNAIKIIQNAKVENWNLDLIFAAAEETLDDWLEDLRKAVDLGPTHLSTYCLTFESDTKLFLKMLAGRKRKPTAQEEAIFYEKSWEFLAKAGYEHYEISNFAKPGYRCAHNMATWQMGQWFGYGPSAASQVREGQNYLRYTNLSDLAGWSAGVISGQRALTDTEELTAAEVAIDAIVFGMRMPEGVDVLPLGARFDGFSYSRDLRELGSRLADEGLLERSALERDCWKLTRQGLLVADAVASELISL